MLCCITFLFDRTLRLCNVKPQQHHGGGWRRCAKVARFLGSFRHKRPALKLTFLLSLQEVEHPEASPIRVRGLAQGASGSSTSRGRRRRRHCPFVHAVPFLCCSCTQAMAHTMAKAMCQPKRHFNGAQVRLKAAIGCITASCQQLPGQLHYFGRLASLPNLCRV